ncbi:MAG: translation elongation factor Ts [Gammaproteobacteria bacterium]
MVKELRERTGAGMMDCKKALEEAGGDMDAAIEAMRKSGIAKAAKKAGRIAAEGTILIQTNDDKTEAVLLEVNSETDFVARDDNFRKFSTGVAATIQKSVPADMPALLAMPFAPDTRQTVEEACQQLILKIGEKITVRRFVLYWRRGDRLGVYIHGGGRIGVLVDMEGGTAELAKDIAMHVAGHQPPPVCISGDQIPPEVLETEKEIFIAQAQESGKPPEIIEKMIAGRIAKYQQENSLLGQTFVKDQDITVGKLLAASSAKVLQFYRFEVGEGLEKRSDNFVEEVMAQARGG